MGGIRVIHQDAIACDVNGEFLPLSEAFTQAIPPVLLVFNRNELRSSETIEEVINFTRRNRVEVIAKQLDDSLQWRKQRGLLELKGDGQAEGFLESYKNTGESEKDRHQICQHYIESELDSVLGNKEEFITQAKLAVTTRQAAHVPYLCPLLSHDSADDSHHALDYTCIPACGNLETYFRFPSDFAFLTALVSA